MPSMSFPLSLYLAPTHTFSSFGSYRSVFNVVFHMKHLGQTLMVQVAKRGASVLKRRKSRNRMDSSSANTNNNNSGSGGNNDGQPAAGQIPPRSESTDGDVVFYTEEPRAGK